MLRATFSLWNSREDYLILTLGYFKGCMTINPKNFHPKRRMRAFQPQKVQPLTWGQKFFCLKIRSLTLLGLGLIKINDVSANFNNPRPSLILNN